MIHKEQVVHQNIKFSDCAFHDRINNLSDITSIDEETGLWNLGLKFTCNNILDHTLVVINKI